MSGSFKFTPITDQSREISPLDGEITVDTDITSSEQTTQFLGLNYIWWIIIGIVIIIITGFLVWWFVIRDQTENSQSSSTNSSTNTTNSSSSTNNSSGSSSSSSNTINGGTTGDNSNNSNNNLTIVNAKSLGYPELGSNPIYVDPFIKYKNLFQYNEFYDEAIYPLSFHLARLFTIIRGTKYYLQFNDPYLPNAWPNPTGELFTWTPTPDQADVYSSFYFKDTSDNKVYQLYVYQRASQNDPKPGCRKIYCGHTGNNDFTLTRLSTKEAEGIVSLTMIQGMIYLTCRTYGVNNGQHEPYNYYIDNGIGRFCSLEKATELKLNSFMSYPIGIEPAQLDMNRFADQIGKPRN